jgi:hypothetical protein
MGGKGCGSTSNETLIANKSVRPPDYVGARGAALAAQAKTHCSACVSTRQEALRHCRSSEERKKREGGSARKRN